MKFKAIIFKKKEKAIKKKKNEKKHDTTRLLVGLLTQANDNQQKENTIKD